MADSLKIARAAATGTAMGILAPVEDASTPESPTPVEDASAPESPSLALVPPPPVAIVDESEATSWVKLDASTLAKLDRMVADFVIAISQLRLKDSKFQARIADIRRLGEDGIKASTQASAFLFEHPVGSKQKGGLAVPAAVSTSLHDLRRQVDSLDPGRQGDLFGTRKLLGFIPLGDPLLAYFAKYQSGQDHINAVLAGLEQGKGELTKGNKELDRDKESLWQTMDRLRQYVYLAHKLDKSLTARIAMVEARDPERARILNEDMQFRVRQKAEDLTAQLAACVHGYLSLEMFRRNNLELIRGLDRVSAATISALRTAVVVAQAVGGQELVLDRITALGAGAAPHEESTAKDEVAASASVDLDTLQASFRDIHAALDEIDAFRLNALETMTKTFEALAKHVGRAQSLLDRTKAAEAATAGGEGGAA
jgi:uncharacterized protein YaaN involved in tellurite resistance